MERNLFRLNLAVLDFDLITREDYRDIFTHTSEVTVPIRDALISDPGRDVEHDNRALSLNVVPIAQPAKFLLPRCVPDIEPNLPKVGVEFERVNLDAKCRHIFLLEFPSQVALHKRRLPYAAIAHKDKFEFWNICRLHGIRRRYGQRWSAIYADIRMVRESFCNTGTTEIQSMMPFPPSPSLPSCFPGEAKCFVSWRKAARDQGRGFCVLDTEKLSRIFHLKMANGRNYKAETQLPTFAWASLPI